MAEVAGVAKLGRVDMDARGGGGGRVGGVRMSSKLWLL